MCSHARQNREDAFHSYSTRRLHPRCIVTVSSVTEVLTNSTWQKWPSVLLDSEDMLDKSKDQLTELRKKDTSKSRKDSKLN